jgi:CRISPR type I-E-associated protein CasB/Cse2
MSQSYQFPENVRRFLGCLRRFAARDDRGALSALRRGASETTRHLAWPIIRQCSGDLRHPAWTAVGAAFAFYPQPEGRTGDGPNFGATCNALAEPRRKDKDGKLVSSFDSRFRRVLAAESAEDLAKWVVQIAKRAKAAKPRPAPINYEELLTALLYWDARDGASREQSRRRWATAYWQPGLPDDTESTEL